MKNKENFLYQEMERMCIDIYYGKIDSDKMLIPETYLKFGLFDGNWIEIPFELSNSEEFKQYMIENFEEYPVVQDGGDVLIFERIKKNITFGGE